MLVENRLFMFTAPVFGAPIGGDPIGVNGGHWNFTEMFHVENYIPALSYDVVCVLLCLAILAELRLVTDGRTDTQPQHIPR